MFNNRRPELLTWNREKLVVVAFFEAQKPIKSSQQIQVNADIHGLASHVRF